MLRHMISAGILLTLMVAPLPAAKPLKAPDGLLKDLNDSNSGGAILLRETELFIDARLIGSLQGAKRKLNQPVKHKQNPVLVKENPWEEGGPGYGTVHYDPKKKLFRMWYQTWKKKEGVSEGNLCLATSKDGVKWTKPVLNSKTGSNLVSAPTVTGFQCPGIIHDVNDPDPARRYKMLFSCAPDGTSATWMTSAAFSPDGIHWKSVKPFELIPFSDTQICPLWDARNRRYMAFLRFGPPNVRLVARTESHDFLHWSPKVTLIRRTNRDEVQATQFYQMAPLAYAGGYIGLIGAYHNESLKPITPEKPWTDRTDLQLAYSRDGVIWSRVGGGGTVTHTELMTKRDWGPAARASVFLPYGNMKKKDWDWGYLTPYFTPEPIIVGNRIHFYYAGANAKHWWTWTGDPPKLDPNAKPPKKGVGLATLRVDGFVSVEAGPQGGTMTTKTFLFLGDTLTINANAQGGSLAIEALDAKGQPIKGFGLAESIPLTSDAISHKLAWKGHRDLHQLQGRPIQLRFHLKNAKLYSITPGTRHTHYVPSYD